MPLSYLNDRYGAQSGANAVSSLAYQLPQLRLAAERLRQQQVMNEAHRILYGAQASELQARTGLYQSQQKQADQRTAQGQEISNALRAAGEARAKMYLAQELPPQEGPSLAGPPLRDTRQDDLANATADYLRNNTIASGNNQLRGEQGAQQALAGIITHLQNNPNLAAALLTHSRLQQNIPANNVSLNAMTGETTPGATSVPAAGMVTMPGQPPVLGQQRTGNIKTPEQQRQEAAFHAASRVGPYGNITNAYNSVMGLPIPGTNAPANVPPSMQLQQGGAPTAPRRIRVKSQDGRTGSMNSDEPIPDGWEVIQ